MTDLRQAAQQALEALETLMLERGSIYDTAITALRTALAQEHALHELARLGQEIEQEPTPWRDMVVATLVREGIDKHRARELADHFAAQRPWVGLTDEDWGWVADKKGTSLDTFDQGAAWAQQRLKERNT
jgi:hypothetical protein